MFRLFLSTLAWESREIAMFGRRVPIPRLEAWYGDAGASYSYSGLHHEPLAWTAQLHALRQRVCEAAGATFNSVLANLYRNGDDSNGWHADDERELGDDPVIASLSLGAPRRFLLRNRDDPTQRYAYELEHGSLLIMQSGVQRAFLHTVPKQRGVREPRINLTFRWINIEGPGAP